MYTKGILNIHFQIKNVLFSLHPDDAWKYIESDVCKNSCVFVGFNA